MPPRKSRPSTRRVACSEPRGRSVPLAEGGHFEPGGAPGLKAADQICRVGESKLLERGGGEARLVALVAHDDHLPAGLRGLWIAPPGARVAAPFEHVAGDEPGTGD